MAIGFPSNPSVNDIHTVGNVSWRWDGTSWVSDSTFNGRMPAGTTAQRPVSPEVGMIRFNTDINALEGYDTTGWKQFYDVDVITTPTAISPVSTDSDIETGTAFNLTSSEYSNSLGLGHTKSFWQIATDTSFSSITLDDSSVSPNLTSYGLDSGLDTADTFYWRVRYQDSSENLSDWSSTASFGTFQGAPTVLGQSYGGGYYIGTICAASSEYYLIVAPNSTGCARCQWKTTLTSSPGACSFTDGYANTYTGLNNADHPAGNWTATRTIGGFSDWYLPAIDELNVLYVNDGGSTNTTLPAGEGFVAGSYWSSTELSGSSSSACRRRFTNGSTAASVKSGCYTIRAVRRVPV